MRVLLVTDTKEWAEDFMTMGTSDVNLEILAVAKPDDFSASRTRAVEPDIVVIKTAEVLPELVSEIELLNGTDAIPVLFFSDTGDDGMDRAAQACVGTHVPSERGLKNIEAVFNWTQIQFKAVETLKKRLKDTERKLADRVVIERAKGLVMKLKDLDEENAYHELRRLAMERSVTMRTVAQAILDSASLLQKN